MKTESAAMAQYDDRLQQRVVQSKMFYRRSISVITSFHASDYANVLIDFKLIIKFLNNNNN